ncbi:MAG TPA: hypothetical protein VH877_29880 [Polyangia bacterium]|jgi:hypothetical protein|nr:hypothetical protein [Polyangia bacterium]
MVLTRRLRLVLLSLLVAMNGLDLCLSALQGEALGGEPRIAASGAWDRGGSLERDLQHDEIDEDTALADPDPDDTDDDDVLLSSGTRLAPTPEVHPWSDTPPALLGFPLTSRLFRPPRALVS